MNDGNICAGCYDSIHDRFYLSAVEKKWHIGCLKCFLCNKHLEEAGSCFSKENKIYCKIDYFRIFGAKKCTKCNEVILKSELVMRARHMVFHMRCFACDVCSAVLAKGEYFGVRGSNVYCKLHFDKPSDPANTNYVYLPTLFSDDQAMLVNENEQRLINKFCDLQNEACPTNRQKGRPRKRKQKYLDGIADTLDINNEYLEMGLSKDCLSSSSRAKRMRTSFKHHQLRAMKSYFAINHNPDAKDLKQLSQKTGLPKRVLQVWFQNARAKFRRMVSKQENKTYDVDEYDAFSSPIRMMSGGISPSSTE